MQLTQLTKFVFVAAFSLGAWQGQLLAQTYFGDSAGDPLPDVGTAGDFESVASVPVSGTIGLDATIDEVIVDLDHTFDGDLDIELVSPSGTTLKLSDNNGGAGDDYTGTMFVDGAPTIGTSGSPPFSGTFEPDGGSMNTAFFGECILGDWKLMITDDFAGDSGTFGFFTITFTTANVACGIPDPPCTVTGYTGDSTFDPIPQSGGTSGPFESTINVPVTGTIGLDASIEFVEVDLEHTFDGDLDITLIAPSGASLDLSSGNGGAGDDYTNTVFMDGGDDITIASAPFTGTFEPEGGTFAAAFAGESINGDWKLGIIDNFAGDNGTFIGVNLAICKNDLICDISVDGATTTPASCIGAADGSITIMASCTTCSGIEYSLDGLDWSNTTGVFNGLTAGTYDIHARDAGDPSCNDMIVDGATVDDGPLPCGWSVDEIGCSGGSASATYDIPSDVWTLSAETCYNPAFYRPTDDQGVVTTTLCGDGEIIAEVLSVSGNGFAGISMREDLSDNSKMLQLLIDGSSLTRRELRQSSPGTAFAHVFPTAGNNWLRLTRTGNTFGAYHSSDGTNWQAVLVTMIPMSTCIEVGLMVENNTPSGTVTGTFGSVSVSGVAPLSTPEVGIDIAYIVEQPTAIDIYPNPASTVVNIKMDDFHGEAAEVQVYNELGQLVIRKVIDEVSIDQEVIDVSPLSNGIYLFKIIADTREETKRVVVKR